MKICECCGENLGDKYPNKKYCSERCKSKSRQNTYKQFLKKYNISAQVMRKMNGSILETNQFVIEIMQIATKVDKGLYERPCEECGKIISNTKNKFCSEKCRTKHHNHTRYYKVKLNKC